jgi:hypothetical protein
MTSAGGRVWLSAEIIARGNRSALLYVGITTETLDGDETL